MRLFFLGCLVLVGLIGIALQETRIGMGQVKGLTTSASRTQPLIINHTSVAEFNRIPSAMLTTITTPSASNRLLFRHASVGGNISGGLNSIQTRNSAYNRSNFVFSSRGNPGWSGKISDLVTQASNATNLATYQYFSMKFCYIDEQASFTQYQQAMDQLEQDHPDKTFIWWTMPIMTATNGNANLRHQFNQQVRAYAQAHNKILFDIADIEAYDPNGNHVVSGGYDVLYTGYTTDGGHLNSTGSERVAEAFWVMMAYLNGWTGSGGNDSSPYDLNGNKVLDNGDVTIFKQRYLTKDASLDFNVDSIINALDFNIFKKAF